MWLMFIFCLEIESKRKRLLHDALEIRRQRHNNGAQIRQFTSSIAVSKFSKNRDWCNVILYNVI